MTIKRWEPSVPDEQMIAEARAEDLMRSIDHWESSPDGYGHTAYDVNGNVVAIGCGRRSRLENDPELDRQRLAGEETQDADDFEGC